jgi:hypothetical protein
MKKSLSFLAIAAAATVLLSLPSTAKAQVTIRGPHGAFSIGGGAFVPEVGAYVPDPYAEEIYEGDDGYGFYYEDEWIPTVRYGTRWIIVQRGGFYGRHGRGYGYARPYAYGRPYGRGYVRPYSYGRRDGFVGRRGFDGRRGFEGRTDGRRFEGRADGRRGFEGRTDGRRGFEGRTDGRGSRNDGRTNRDGRRGTDRRW